MRELFYKFLIFLFLIPLAVPAFGQSNSPDPLAPMNFPSIDENTADYPANVWVTSSLAKVHQDSGAPGSVKWAILNAAKNEFVSFQIHEQAGGSPITLTNVAVSDLVNSVTGTHISASTNIIVYREAYYHVWTASDANGSTGLTPDILIPTIDPYWKQARNAFPVTIAANQNQSVWFDILVPPSAPSGYYKGTVTVTNGGSTYATLPVVLGVWNFSIPSTATLRSLYYNDWNGPCQGFYSHGSCTSYPKSGGASDAAVALSNVDTATMALDHRISMGWFVYPPPINPPINWTGFDGISFDTTQGPLLNGTAGPNTSTLLSGAKMTSLVYASAQGSQVNTATIQAWIDHFTAKGWLGVLFAYSYDEPNGGGPWSTIVANANKSTGYTSTTPHLPAMVTTDIADAMANNAAAAINLMVANVVMMEPQNGGNQRSAYNTWLASVSGNQLWMYQSCNSHGACSNGTPGNAANTWPSNLIDASPVRNRVMQWIEWMDNVSGDLYYDLTYCWVSTCADGNGNNGTDPWIYQYYSGGNGDGTLIYPGPISKIGGTTPIPLPSIRLKNIRDGMEDYEYLNALSKAGLGSFATAEAQSFITNAYTFNNDPAALTNARLALGNKLHQITLSGQPQPPPGLSIIVK